MKLKNKLTIEPCEKLAKKSLNKSFVGSRGHLQCGIKIPMETIRRLNHRTPSLHCKCSPTQWGFSKEPLAAGGIFARVSIFKLVIAVIVLLVMVSGGTADARAIYKDVPGKIDTKARYLFYLHGRIIEIKGIRPTSERYGVYEYEKILETFKDKGFIVISEARGRNTRAIRYARKMVSQVNALVQAGVPPAHITVVGASKGALIAMLLSSMLQNKDMNFVFISGCTHQILQKFDIDFWGNVLTIYDEKDELVGTCKKFFEVSTGLNHYKEIKLTVGIGHGILYRPIKEWVDPVVKWARGQR